MGNIVLRTTLLALVVVCLSSASVCLGAQEVGRVAFPTSGDYVLASYSVRHDMLPEADPLPLVTIYGDGRVLVHRPSYFKTPGDFELWLSSDQLQKLCSKMVTPVMTYKEQSIVESAGQSAEFEGGDYAISDNSVVGISLNLHAVQMIGSDGFEAVAKKKLRVRNISARANIFPQANSIQKLAAIEKAMRELLYSQQLSEIRQ